MREPFSREEYRRAFDEIPFSDDFQEQTRALLQERLRNMEKEEPNMKVRKSYRWIVAIAAVAALLMISVSAAVLWLSPWEAAEESGDSLLAQALSGEEAIVLNESAQAGEYTITLGGLVTGAGISDWCEDVDESLTYAVVSVARTDATPLTEDIYDISLGGNFIVTPLVSGYAPQAVNVFTLNGHSSSFMHNGTAYYIVDTKDIQMFADHTVYLAVYQGFVPSYREFAVAEDGTMTMRDDVMGCLFTLPLNPALADPDAAQSFLEESGMDVKAKTDEELAALGR